jgi:hypothetical protein
LSLPRGARRLFSAYDEADLTSERSGSLLIARLLEDGDAADLGWLFRTFSEPAVAEWLARLGGRQLSRRSRAFWEVVLGVEAVPAGPVSDALWPL